MPDKPTPALAGPKTLNAWQEEYVAEWERREPFFTVFPSMLMRGCRTWRDYFVLGFGELPEGPPGVETGEE
jgi:hypothetical protein